VAIYMSTQLYIHHTTCNGNMQFILMLDTISNEYLNMHSRWLFSNAAKDGTKSQS